MRQPLLGNARYWTNELISLLVENKDLLRKKDVYETIINPPSGNTIESKEELRYRLQKIFIK